MLRFFRINDPYRLLGLLILFLVISLPVLIGTPGVTWPELTSFIIGEKISEGFTPYSELINSTPPLSQWMHGIIDVIAGRSLSVRHSLGFFLLFLQAAYLGIVFINKKAFTENTYVPSLLFVLLCSISFDMLSITDTLLASAFLLLAINSIFKSIEFREQQDENLLKIGFYLSLATLADFSCIVFFFGTIIILLLFTRSSVRKQLLFITSFVLPHSLLLGWFFLQGNLVVIWEHFYLPSLLPTRDALFSISGILTLCVAPIVYFIISFFILNRAVRLTNYQSQLLQSMFIWLIVGIVQLFFVQAFRPQSLLLLFPPLSFLLAHYFLAIRRRRLAELHLWIFMIGIVTSATLARLGYFESVSYDRLVVKDAGVSFPDKRILHLGKDNAVYLHHTLATGISEWELVNNKFENPNSYEHVLFVNRQLSSDLPDIILDKNHLLQPFLDRLPELRKQYLKKKDYYQLIPSTRTHGANP